MRKIYRYKELGGTYRRCSQGRKISL